MKRCNGCERDLPEEDFGKNSSKKDGLQTRCKLCRKGYAADWYLENKDVQVARNKAYRRTLVQEVRDFLLKHPCPCGEARPECLEFDHIDPSTKVANVADLLGKGYRKKLWDEIAKCQVLCANCHRIKTAKQFGWFLALDGLGT